MKKIITPLLLTLIITGCTNNATNNDSHQNIVMKESLLISANNELKLIEFYKNNIDIDPSYKVKLVNLYLDQKDIRSADLYINTYTTNELEQPSFILSKAKSLHYKKEYNLANRELDRYLTKGGSKEQYYLLSGKISSELGHYRQAIKAFEESKKVGVSDQIANNNIAVVEMMQTNFYAANTIFEKLYNDYPNDKKIKSNFLMVLVHMGRFNVALDILKKDYSNEKSVKLLTNMINSIKDPAYNIIHDETIDHYATDDENNNATTNETKPKIIEAVNKQPNKRIFRVQILAISHKKNVPDKYIPSLQLQYGDVYSYTADNWKKYSIGHFDTYEEAKAFKNTVKINGVFIVNNGNKFLKVMSQ